MSRPLTYYQGLVTSQHRNRPKFTAWLAAALEIAVDVAACADAMFDAFDIDNAVGVQLDALGVIVGAVRTVPFEPTGGASPILDDATYRTLIKARVALNQWDGTIDGIQAFWKFIFPDRSIVIQDNQDMTMNAICIGVFSTIEQDLISNGYIVPKPEGVGINYAFGPVFAYDSDTNTMKGYDEGVWVNT